MTSFEGMRAQQITLDFIKRVQQDTTGISLEVLTEYLADSLDDLNTRIIQKAYFRNIDRGVKAQIAEEVTKYGNVIQSGVLTILSKATGRETPPATPDRVHLL